MVELTENQAQLAAVIADEIAHVQARHGSERVSQGLALEGGLAAIDAAMQDVGNQRYIMGALGVGAQLGVQLPYSRLHESESDQIGIDLMARAGFDPHGAVKLWQLMQARSGEQPIEFLSTHPSHEDRIAHMEEHLNEAMEAYRNAQQKGLTPSCEPPTTARR